MDLITTKTTTTRMDKDNMRDIEEGDKFIAECEYTCGYSYGPAEHADVWRNATAHAKDCMYGGPVIRNVKTPAPSWVNDPLMLDLLMEPTARELRG